MDEKIPEEYAKKLMSYLRELDTTIVSLDNLCSNMDAELHKLYKEKLKQDIGRLLLVSYKLVQPIIRQYPTLDPDKKT